MVLEELATYMQANGIGTLGTNLFVGTLPSTPDTCVGLQEYPGTQPAYALGGGLQVLEFPRVQVMTRAKLYNVARDKADDVWRLLGAITGQTLSGVHHLRVQALSNPFELPPDDTNRKLFACNYVVTKELSP